MPSRLWEKDRAELSLADHQVLVIGSDDWFMPRKIEFKGCGSQTANNAVAKGSQTPRFRISSETYTRCCQTNQKNVYWGIKKRFGEVKEKCHVERFGGGVKA